MVEQLRQVLGPDLLARMQEIKMTLHEVLTLASVIEKETGPAASGLRFPRCFTTGSRSTFRYRAIQPSFMACRHLTEICARKTCRVPVPTIRIGCKGCHLDRLPTRAFRRFARHSIPRTQAICILSRGTTERTSSLRRWSNTTGQWRNIRSGPFVAGPTPRRQSFQREGFCPQRRSVMSDQDAEKSASRGESDQVPFLLAERAR